MKVSKMISFIEQVPRIFKVRELYSWHTMTKTVWFHCVIVGRMPESWHGDAASGDEHILSGAGSFPR